MAAEPRPTEEQRFTGASAAQIAALVEPAVAEHGLFLEELALKPGGAVAVLRLTVDYISGTEQVDLDTLAEVSSAVSTVLDEADTATEDSTDAATAKTTETGATAGAAALAALDNYELEVTTPGATRPLSQPRHFRRNLERLLELDLTQPDGAQRSLTGRLKKVDDDGIEVVEQVPPPKKGMPVKHLDPVHISFAAIARARVQVEFSHRD